MKRILITGAGSYIGSSLLQYLKQWPDAYHINAVTMQDGAWKNEDFSQYDVVFHAAGIAHRKETADNAHLYYEVNRDLALKVAEKAKEHGIRQFIFLSSISIYGLDTGIITPETIPAPVSHYGKSKLEAENLLKNLADPSFRLTIIRPPMVYGKNCKGNFQKLVRLVEVCPIFPKCGNQRSMIFIDNLCEIVKVCIDNSQAGIFCPQNKEYVSTDKLIALIAKEKDKKVIISDFIGQLIKPFIEYIRPLRKAFGSLILDGWSNQASYSQDIDFKDSIKKSIQRS